jgi:predicted nucleotidyltransferase
MEGVCGEVILDNEVTASKCYTVRMVTRRQIDDLARRIAEEFRPERIILFGSYAHGNPTEDSDVDLLVVMKMRGDVVEKGAEIYVAVDKAGAAPFSIDILVRTPKQIRERVAMNDFFMREITEHGRVIYEAADSGVGRKGRKRLPKRVA